MLAPSPYASAATERLARLGAGAPVPAGAFQSALGAVAQSPSDAALRTQLATSGAPSDAIGKPVDPRAKPFKGLEALVLQNLVETMLPKDAGAYFGESAGGGMWRSMLAQRIGEQLSTRMDLGLASKAAEIHTPADLPLPRSNDALVAEIAGVSAGGAHL